MHFLPPFPPFHLLLDCGVTFLLLRLFDCTCQSPSFDDVEGINGETDLEEEREEEREEDLEDVEDDVDGDEGESIGSHLPFKMPRSAPIAEVLTSGCNPWALPATVWQSQDSRGCTFTKSRPSNFKTSTTYGFLDLPPETTRDSKTFTGMNDAVSVSVPSGSATFLGAMGKRKRNGRAGASAGDR